MGRQSLGCDTSLSVSLLCSFCIIHRVLTTIQKVPFPVVRSRS
jgi:hypothetical protein